MDSQLSEEPLPTEKSNDFDEPKQKPPRWTSVWVAWIAILASILWAVLPHFMAGQDDDGESSIIGPEIYGKYLIGLSSLPFAPKDNFRDVISSVFEKGPLRQQLMGTVLVGEFDGPAAAVKSLRRLEGRVETRSIVASSADQEVLKDLLKMQNARIEKQAFESTFSDDERRHIERLLPDHLGWIGKLALLPAETTDTLGRSNLLQQARRTLFAVLGVAAFVIFAMMCGGVMQITLWVFAITGRLKSGIGPIRGNDCVYAETFAVWMFLYIELSRLISLPFISKWGMVTILIPQIGSLVALAWPVIRGLHWRDIREDLGLTVGRQSWTNPLIGIGTYLSAFPVLFFGALMTLAMMAVANRLGMAGEEATAPIHPVVEPILRGSWAARLQVLLVVVFAAVPEEIMFRGVLYRHLRERAARFGYTGSVVCATLISSFIFAAIHPQGLFGIPLLMGLAIVFALAREWRGTLIPSMIAHALVNAGTSSILFLIGD